MKDHNIDIRQLRETRQLKRAGKTVELRERDKVIARIVPQRSRKQPGELPDFAARRKNRSSTDRSHSKSLQKDSGPFTDGEMRVALSERLQALAKSLAFLLRRASQFLSKHLQAILPVRVDLFALRDQQFDLLLGLDDRPVCFRLDPLLRFT